MTSKQQLDELAKVAASLVKTAEAHDRQIASTIRALDKQRGVVNALPRV